MTTLTFKVPDHLVEELEEICKQQDRSKSWLMKKALQEKLEEWRDLRVAMKGRADYENNPESFLTHDEFWEEIEKRQSE